MILAVFLLLPRPAWADAADRRLEAARSWMAEGGYDAARDELSALLRELRPDDHRAPAATYLLAICEEQSLDFDAALHHYDSLLHSSTDPGVWKDAALRGARLRLLLGREDEALAPLRHLHRTASADARPVVAVNLAWAEARTGRPGRARMLLSQAIPTLRARSDASAQWTLHQAHVVAGRLALARAERIDLRGTTTAAVLRRIRQRARRFAEAEGFFGAVTQGGEPFWAQIALLEGGEAYVRFAEALAEVAREPKLAAPLRQYAMQWAGSMHQKAVGAFELCSHVATAALERGPIRAACLERLELVRPAAPRGAEGGDTQSP